MVGSVLVVGVVSLLLVAGPPGSAYRTNGAFAACIEDALIAELTAEEYMKRSAECFRQLCPDGWEPSRIEKIGLFAQTRLSGRDGPSCVWPPELGDIFLPEDNEESEVFPEP